eukprot:178723-Pleurochrysis_carterae.AAC.1
MEGEETMQEQERIAESEGQRGQEREGMQRDAMDERTSERGRDRHRRSEAMVERRRWTGEVRMGRKRERGEGMTLLLRISITASTRVYAFTLSTSDIPERQFFWAPR